MPPRFAFERGIKMNLYCVEYLVARGPRDGVARVTVWASDAREAADKAERFHRVDPVQISYILGIEKGVAQLPLPIFFVSKFGRRRQIKRALVLF